MFSFYSDFNISNLSDEKNDPAIYNVMLHLLSTMMSLIDIETYMILGSSNKISEDKRQLKVNGKF